MRVMLLLLLLLPATAVRLLLGSPSVSSLPAVTAESTFIPRVAAEATVRVVVEAPRGRRAVVVNSLQWRTRLDLSRGLKMPLMLRLVLLLRKRRVLEGCSRRGSRRWH